MVSFPYLSKEAPDEWVLELRIVVMWVSLRGEHPRIRYLDPMRFKGSVRLSSLP